MATFIDLLLSISVALLILTVAFGIFIRAHERTVLARAVRWHLEDRIVVHGNRTVVFG